MLLAVGRAVPDPSCAPYSDRSLVTFGPKDGLERACRRQALPYDLPARIDAEGGATVPTESAKVDPRSLIYKEQVVICCS